jgi:hypothetical protein
MYQNPIHPLDGQQRHLKGGRRGAEAALARRLSTRSCMRDQGKFLSWKDVSMTKVSALLLADTNSNYLGFPINT